MQCAFARAGVLCAALAGSTASGQVVFFDFLLDGGQEVPAVETPAFGFATLAYDTAARTFDLGVFISGIGLGDLLGVGPNASPIHLHAAPRGSNGPIVIDLGLTGVFADEGDGIISFLATGVAIGGPQGAVPASDPDTNEALLFSGGLYLNVHTTAFTGGEIRGQVIPAAPGAAIGAIAGLAAARRRR